MLSEFIKSVINQRRSLKNRHQNVSSSMEFRNVSNIEINKKVELLTDRLYYFFTLTKNTHPRIATMIKNELITVVPKELFL